MRWADGTPLTIGERALLGLGLLLGALLMFTLSYPILAFWLLLPVGE